MPPRLRRLQAGGRVLDHDASAGSTPTRARGTRNPSGSGLPFEASSSATSAWKWRADAERLDDHIEVRARRRRDDRLRHVLLVEERQQLADAGQQLEIAARGGAEELLLALGQLARRPASMSGASPRMIGSLRRPKVWVK